MENILGIFGGGGGSGFSPFSESRAQEHYQDLYLQEQPRHESSLTHEAVAAAAGFAAMHAYESHLRATGQPVSHGKMKEILAAIAAAEVDKLAETKGLDWLDRHKVKKLAEHQAHALAEQRYGEGDSGWDYASSQRGPAQEYNFYGGAPYGAQGCPSYGWYGERYDGGGGGGYGGGGYGGGGYGGGGGYEGRGGYEGGGPGYGGGGYGGGYGGGGPPPPPGGYGGYPQEQGYGGGYGGGGYGQPPPPPQGYYGGGYEQGPPRGYEGY